MGHESLVASQLIVDEHSYCFGRQFGILTWLNFVLRKSALSYFTSQSGGYILFNRPGMGSSD